MKGLWLKIVLKLSCGTTTKRKEEHNHKDGILTLNCWHVLTFWIHLTIKAILALKLFFIWISASFFMLDQPWLFSSRCKVDRANHPAWLVWIKALLLTDRTIKGGLGEERRWTALLVYSNFLLVSSPAGDGSGSWEFGQSFFYMLSPSGGPDLSVAPMLINHCPASVAPAVHIRVRINASGGGDLVNPTAATIGHLGLTGKRRPCFIPKQWEIS